MDQPLFEVRTLYNYGTSERRRGPGRALEAVAIVQIMLNTRGRVIWNKQIGANQQFMFHPVYHYEHPEKFDGRTSVGGEPFTYRGGCYSRVDVADAYFSEGEDELEVCIEEEEPDFTLRFEPQMLEMLVFACGELPVTHEAIEAIVAAAAVFTDTGSPEDVCCGGNIKKRLCQNAHCGPVYLLGVTKRQVSGLGHGSFGRSFAGELRSKSSKRTKIER